MKFLRLSVILLVAAKLCSAQQIIPATHSHNDYEQTVPFFHAYNAGFNAIEADIFMVNSTLLVAHDYKHLQATRTLKKLYLDPIKEALKKDTSRHLTLLIDLKQDYWYLMPELILELKSVRKFCVGHKPNGRLLILISGNRPAPSLFNTYPDFIFFDEDLRHTYNAEQLKRVGQISLQYSLYSKWKGVGTIPPAQEQRLKHIIDSVHSIGKTIRFWDAPDNKAGWTQLMKLHADVIGTDNIDGLTAFLKQN
ncbi:PI-PLC domain-containing protein [Mucilaginibacter boryungensis]|uniref:Alkaline phosphatase n=1 Tax=Mucilaginibacter boryungensis TaxID=768480 RepID=A0ABR9XG75_9SPHI|nr:alkaline phosphatase [Mucilaginibacter boryungensis]MBE9666195.1 alkaline phosphatase [Mucilaginibacter boryungensis]